jgi:putative peptidoglycan lipid II flippase
VNETQGHHEREHFFRSAKVVAVLTMLSRILGLIRDRAIFAFGANRATSTFWTAFRIPNTFRRMFGEGALSAAFVPVFTEVTEAEGWDKARLVLANAAGALAVLLGVLLVVIEVGLGVWFTLSPGAWDKALLLQLLMIVMPFMFTICMLSLGAAALNCRGRFVYPAFAPIILNIFLIAAAYIARIYYSDAPTSGLVLLSIAVTVAGIVQLVGVIWALRAAGLGIIPNVKPLLPEVCRMGKLMLPMMIPLGAVQLSSLFDGWYAWSMAATLDSPTLTIFGWTFDKPLLEGAATRIFAAERLYNFPLGILAISIATVVFPLFSRYAARNDTHGLREATNRALRLCLFLGIPSGVALMVLGGPAVSAIYRSGEFTPEDAAQSGYILQMYCIGMWAYFSNHVLLRAFFSQKDVMTPLKASIVRALLNILLVGGLIFTPLGPGAMGLATAITSSGYALLLVWILHRRWGRIGFREIMASLLRIAVSTAAMLGAMLLAWRFIVPLLGRISPRLGSGNWQSDWIPAVALLVVCMSVGLGTYLLSAKILRCPELRELLIRERK